MEWHLYEIICFVTYILSVFLTVLFMKRADDEGYLRRLIAVIGLGTIYFNPQIGTAFYMILGSLLETILAMAGVSMLLITAVILAFFPFLLVIRWLIRR